MYKEFHGEFLVNSYVDEIIRTYYPDYNYKGVFFDVGAFEPIKISNSYHFEKNGWTCYLFEANPEQIPKLTSVRKNVFNYAIYNTDKDNITFNVVSDGNWTAGFSAIELSSEYDRIFPCNTKTITQVSVLQRKLDTIIENEIKDLKHIDVLSIDIEGGELKALQGFNLNKYKPKLIVVENVNNNSTLVEYLKAHNYSLHKHIAYNQFFIYNS